MPAGAQSSVRSEIGLFRGLVVSTRCHVNLFVSIFTLVVVDVPVVACTLVHGASVSWMYRALNTESHWTSDWIKSEF